VLVGELAVNRVLTADLPEPGFPDALRESAPPVWRNLASGALQSARGFADRGDAAACFAHLGQAVLASAQGRLAAAGEWALNEKRIVDRSGLSAVQRIFSARGAPLAETVANVDALLGGIDPASRWASVSRG
jgi:hypothetical protein